jgi:hypothetical protein
VTTDRFADRLVVRKRNSGCARFSRTLFSSAPSVAAISTMKGSVVPPFCDCVSSKLHPTWAGYFPSALYRTRKWPSASIKPESHGPSRSGEELAGSLRKLSPGKRLLTQSIRFQSSWSFGVRIFPFSRVITKNSPLKSFTVRTYAFAFFLRAIDPVPSVFWIS